MEVYWLEQAEADVPVRNDWLSAAEALRLNGMRFKKRRADWRLGRWTAKRAVAIYLDAPRDAVALSVIEIRPAPSGAPEVFYQNQPAEVCISLSHSGGRAVCAVARPGTAVGCDLELVEERSAAFLGDYLTEEEQSLVARAFAADKPWLSTLLWSAKESALKALREGLRIDTRCVIVSVENALERQGADGMEVWRPMHVQHSGGQIFQGWWQHTGDFVRTLVTAPAPDAPILYTDGAAPVK